MRALFLNNNNIKNYFFLVFPKENPRLQLSFLCSLVRTFLATFRIYTFVSRAPFGNATYFRIVHWYRNAITTALAFPLTSSTRLIRPAKVLEWRELMLHCLK